MECKRAEQLRELHFYRGDQEINPGEIVQELYSPLKPLIDLNIKRHEIVKGANKEQRDRKSGESIFKGLLEKYSNESRVAVGDYKDNDFSARAHFNDGSKSEFRVLPRTNFSDYSLKTPNIFFLRDENDNQLVLREARKYDFEGYMGKFVLKQLQDTHRRKVHFEVPESVKRNEMVVIPEPKLVLALEQLNEEETIKRITPRMRLLGIEDDKLWYVRNFLPPLRDTSMDIEKLTTYVGTLHGLGLIDAVDSQVAHYCINQKGRVVNIDPDFLAYTSHYNTLHNLDWNDFRKRLDEMVVTKSQVEEIKQGRKKQMRSLHERMGGKTLLDHLPEKLSESSAIDFLKTENAFISD